MADRVDELHQRRLRVLAGDSAATARHRDRGKLTARDRIERLLDRGTFTEFGMFAEHRTENFGKRPHPSEGDGVVTGWGEIDGRRAFVFAHDARVMGGALGEVYAAKLHQLMDYAESVGAPVIGLNDGGGARIQEGLDALSGFGGLFSRNVRASGVIPQISVILGSCAGGAVYSPALTDFTIMVRDIAHMFITGPDVVQAVTGERISLAALGGTEVHGAVTGVACTVVDDEAASFDEVRYLLSFLPSNNAEAPPSYDSDDDPYRRTESITDMVPLDARSAYDIRQVIAEIVDDGDYFEVQPEWAKNIVCALTRLDGQTVGVVANQPNVLAGVLDIESSEKGARFVRMCDAFNIPLVTLVDVPGFLPGKEQEHHGIIRHGAKLLYAYCEATVPRIQLILRKAFGGAYIVMDSKSIGSDLSLAWPSCQVGVMGPEGAARIIFREQIRNADNPELSERQMAQEYERTLLDPYTPAAGMHVDSVIDPAETRSTLIRSLAMLRDKHARQPVRKHGNGPL